MTENEKNKKNKDIEFYGVQNKSFYDGVPTEELSINTNTFEDVFSSTTDGTEKTDDGAEKNVGGTEKTVDSIDIASGKSDENSSEDFLPPPVLPDTDFFDAPKAHRQDEALPPPPLDISVSPLDISALPNPVLPDPVLSDVTLQISEEQKPLLKNVLPKPISLSENNSYGSLPDAVQAEENNSKDNFKLKIISSNTVRTSLPPPQNYEDVSSSKKPMRPEREAVKKKKKNKKSFAQRNFPQKGDSVSEVIRKIIFIVAVLTLAGCICYFTNLYVIQPYIEKMHENELNSMRGDDSDWEDLNKLYPGVNFPEDMKLSMAQAYAKNKDFVGWLDVQNMMISTPVVQTSGKDSKSPYLKKSFYGSKSKYGCPFLGSECGVEELSRNTVIYGHNMEYDDLVFGMLENYRTIDGYEKAPQIKFETLYKTYLFDIYAVMVVNATPSSSRYINYVFADCDDTYFAKYIKMIDERKLYDTGVSLSPSDKIITLSTCTYDYDNARLVVIGKLSAVGQ